MFPFREDTARLDRHSSELHRQARMGLVSEESGSQVEYALSAFTPSSLFQRHDAASFAQPQAPDGSLVTSLSLSLPTPFLAGHHKASGER